MATLNVCSMSFGAGEFRNPPDGVRRLAARMRELGIKPELEIYDTGHLDVPLHAASQEDLLAEPLAVLDRARGARRACRHAGDPGASWSRGSRTAPSGR